MRIVKAPVPVVLALFLAACGSEPAPPPPSASVGQPGGPAFDSAFWQVWGDGLAEVAAYDLIQPRYKAPRAGVAVTIFVSEPFSNSVRVKADPGAHPPEDEFPVMKLNFLKDYQTGVYRYTEMQSSFVALKPVNARPSGSLTKVSFSSQEWCGHVFSQLLLDPASIRLMSHSYFDGEADENRVLEYPADGVTEDSLMHWARGMAWPVVEPGETRTVPLLTSLATARETHSPVAWGQVRLSRGAETVRLTTPAGVIETEMATASINDGARTIAFHIEKAAPRRIVQWETNSGEKGVLLASDRMAYWQMNQPGGEEALKRLGLAQKPARTY
ncbi:MAG: hypothetical protein IPM24_11070 [Bryobacterales bacterium]|nr:hypothetical protein [Bryobacterales bacterium]